LLEKILSDAAAESEAKKHSRIDMFSLNSYDSVTV
jgi:hypothetical protein